MIWDDNPDWVFPTDGCAGRPLLFLNEPELLDQANMTPQEGANLLWQWREWDGPLYCCGNQYSDRGYQWFVDMRDAYTGTLPIDGLHIHTYTVSQLDKVQLRKWRQLADSNGWEIVVTEVGLFPTDNVTVQDIADALPSLLETVSEELRPAAIFWFAYRVHPDTLYGGMQWDKAALYNFDTEAITPVGEAWERYTQSEY